MWVDLHRFPQTKNFDPDAYHGHFSIFFSIIVVILITSTNLQIVALTFIINDATSNITNYENRLI